MKNLSLILMCLAFFYSCKEQASKSNPTSNTTKTKTKISKGKVEDFECSTFFEKGDYSLMCFTDNKLPEYINRGCIYDFVTKGEKQEQSIKIQFAGKSSASLTAISINIKSAKHGKYKKGKLKDISNLGDAAFFDIHDTDLKSLSRSNKDLHVLHKNISFVLMAEYLTNKGTPCFYDDKEMIAFAKTIISIM